MQKICGVKLQVLNTLHSSVAALIRVSSTLIGSPVLLTSNRRASIGNKTYNTQIKVRNSFHCFYFSSLRAVSLSAHGLWGK